MRLLTVHTFILVLVGALVGEFTSGIIRKLAWTIAAVAAVTGALMAWAQR